VPYAGIIQISGDVACGSHIFSLLFFLSPKAGILSVNSITNKVLIGSCILSFIRKIKTKNKGVVLKSAN
jgi:hypothetical protein